MNKEQIKVEFARVILNAKIIAAFFFITLAPTLVVTLKELDGLFGIDKQQLFNASIAGFIIYMGYVLFYWKCPSCKKFPGRGWFRKECDNCGCELS